jgi:hypothetical protein
VESDAGMKQAHVVALLLVLVALGIVALIIQSQVVAAKIPGTPNQTMGQLPQGGATTNIHDQVVLEGHVSVVVCYKTNSVGSMVGICEETP